MYWIAGRCHLYFLSQLGECRFFWHTSDAHGNYHSAEFQRAAFALRNSRPLWTGSGRSCHCVHSPKKKTGEKECCNLQACDFGFAVRSPDLHSGLRWRREHNDCDRRQRRQHRNSCGNLQSGCHQHLWLDAKREYPDAGCAIVYCLAHISD